MRGSLNILVTSSFLTPNNVYFNLIGDLNIQSLFIEIVCF